METRVGAQKASEPYSLVPVRELEADPEASVAVDYAVDEAVGSVSYSYLDAADFDRPDPYPVTIFCTSDR